MSKLLIQKDKIYYVADEKSDFHSAHGVFSKEVLAGKDGSAVKSNTGKEFSVLSSSFIDDYRKIRRLAQIIPSKDIGAIILETGLGSDSLVVDAGTGSGALAIMLSRFAKKVVSYDIREDHLKIAEKNIKRLSITNLELKQGDITQPIDEKNIDILTLDIPNPWDALHTADKALRPGGYLVSYSPTIPQVADLVNSLPDSLLHMKTVEIIEREWEVSGRKVRPRSQAIGHSGFLTYVRKIL